MRHSDQKANAPVAIVTGGNSGIGEAIVKLLAARDYTVLVAGRRRKENERVGAEADSLGEGRMIPFTADVSEEVDCLKLIQTTAKEQGRLDLLVNNAGIGGFNPITETTSQEFDRVMKTNLYSAYWCAREAFRIMKEQPADERTLRGSIVNMSSVCGVDAWSGAAVYCTSKHGMMGLTRALADEGAEAMIRVAAICPAMVATPMTGREGPEYIAPDDIARTLSYLLDLSPAAWPRASSRSSRSPAHLYVFEMRSMEPRSSSNSDSTRRCLRHSSRT
ncbi:MAG: SDR family NAD(P)-dependent oxidoreductase [Verrucomicrobiota bacterium]